MNTARVFLLFIATVTSAACTNAPTVSRQPLGGSDTLATTADARLIYMRPVTAEKPSGRITPNEVLCAEPSPDVAKAFSSAFGASAEAEAKALPALSAAGDVKAALNLSRSRSEAIAQLGKRLGTIQLLRNGLFSACEAYANGAISPMSYAFLLSRFGDLMVTLLSVELVSGDTQGTGSTTTKASADASNAGRDQGASGTTEAGAPGSTQGSGAGGGTSGIAKTQVDGKTGSGAKGVSTESSSSSNMPENRQAGLSDAQTKAIVELQQAFLRGGEAGPMVLACAVALDSESARDPAISPSATEANFRSICGGFLKDYGAMVIKTITAERMRELKEATQETTRTKITANP